MVWRLSGCRGNPSSGIVPMGCIPDELTNVRTDPGSWSKVPMRIPIGSAWLGLCPKREEPQSPQNHFSPPASGFQTRRRSSPFTIRNVPGAGWAFGDAAAPLLRWQRRQWMAATSGADTSYRTAPQLQPPVRGRSVTATSSHGHEPPPLGWSPRTTPALGARRWAAAAQHHRSAPCRLPRCSFVVGHQAADDPAAEPEPLACAVFGDSA